MVGSGAVPCMLLRLVLEGYLRVYYPHWLGVWSIEYSSHTTNQSGDGNTRWDYLIYKLIWFTEITRKLFNIIIALSSRYYHATNITNSYWIHSTQLWSYRLLLCIGWKCGESVGSDTIHAFLHHVRHALSTGNTTTFRNKPSQYTQHTLALS